MDRDDPKFPALRTAAFILKAAAVIGTLVCLAVAVVAFFNTQNTPTMRLSIIVLYLLAAGASWVTGMILPELIEVLLAIEHNTRRAARKSSQPPPDSDEWQC
jgi:hypothetical protein